MPVYSAVIDVNDENNIIIGTEFGIWSTKNGSSWIVENDGMPLVPCHMLRQQTLPGVNKGVIYVGTHGRGFFKSTSTSSVFEVIENNDDNKDNLDLNIYPNPSHDFVNIESSLSNYDIQIFDLIGKQVYSSESIQNNIKIDVSDFEAGTYIIITSGLEGKEYGQFVKSK